MNTALLTRPFSCHKPRHPGHAPQIRGTVSRISKSRRNCWRAEVFVGGAAMATGHHDTKVAAESWLGRILESYTDIHYESH